MARLPAAFDAEFEHKGETFRGIAELLYTTPDRQYTQAELADRFGVSTAAISGHLREMEAAGWIERTGTQTTFGWDTDTRDPGHTEWAVAITRFYADCWRLFKTHSQTAPGVFAMWGLVYAVTAGVGFLVFVVFALGVGVEAAVTDGALMSLAVAFLVTGVVLTILAPVQAFLTRTLWRAVFIVE